MKARPRARLVERLDALSDRQAVLCTVALVFLVGAADGLAPPCVSFTLAYLAPIALAAWRLGRTALLLTVLSCAATWLGMAVATRELALPPLLDAASLLMELGVFASFGFALTSLRRRLRAEQRLARTDPLTGLHNRRAFQDDVERAIARARRDGRRFSLAYLDVDDFKLVNDRFGHRRGDELLQDIAAVLIGNTRAGDVAARLGGDEFALLLPDTGEDGAEVLLERLVARLRDDLDPRCRVSVSIGCLTVHEPPADVDSLVARADALMYSVKQTDRGSVRHELVDGDAVVLQPVPRRTRSQGKGSPAPAARS